MNSSITALPPRMLVVVCVPAYSTQVVDPVSGLTRRFRSAFQLPTIQSKSWRPSRGAGPVASDGAAEAVCAPAGQAMASPIATRPMARNGTNARKVRQAWWQLLAAWRRRFPSTLRGGCGIVKEPLSMQALIPLERGREPLSRQIYGGLRRAVLSGTFAAGERLPSTRDLAEQLGVSRTVVVLAYEQLLSEGFVVGRAGAGTFVPVGLTAAPAGAGPLPVRPRLSRFGAFAADVRSAVEFPAKRPATPRYDFAYGRSDVDCFPFEHWWRLLHRCARADRGPRPRLRRRRRHRRPARGDRRAPAAVAIGRLRRLAGGRRQRLAAGARPRRAGAHRARRPRRHRGSALPGDARACCARPAPA